MLIGGFAVIIQGYERFTSDLDVCYERDRENIRRLVQVLHDLRAVPRDWPAGVPFLLDEETILNGDSFTFATDLGHLDILGTPDGTRGYADLAVRRERYAIGPNLSVDVASIGDLVRMKQASSTQPHRRAKDLDDLEALMRLAELQRHGSASP